MFEDSVAKILRKWAAAGPTGLEPALRICRDLIFFEPDPREQEKIERGKNNARDWGARLDPSLRFQEWEYAQLLDNGVRPLAMTAPLATAKLLIDALADMLVLDTGHGPEGLDLQRNDASEI